MASLLEKYSPQMKIAEAYVANTFDKKISDNTKLATAVVLNNTNKFITESMNTDATQRSDLGAWKKFC